MLDANSLDDIMHTRQIAAVYLRGVEVDRGRLRARWTEWSRAWSGLTRAARGDAPIPVNGQGRVYSCARLRYNSP